MRPLLFAINYDFLNKLDKDRKYFKTHVKKFWCCKNIDCIFFNISKFNCMWKIKFFPKLPLFTLDANFYIRETDNILIIYSLLYSPCYGKKTFNLQRFSIRDFTSYACRTKCAQVNIFLKNLAIKSSKQRLHSKSNRLVTSSIRGSKKSKLQLQNACKT